MAKQEFVDYYEVLEVSPNANSYTIERVFRFLAKRFHPDVAESGDMQRFSQIVEAYDTLRDPKERAAYDVQFTAQKQSTAELVQEAQHVGDDSADRHQLLTLFYAQRRRNYKQPGVGVGALENAMACPAEILEFHLWYFREKNWVQREESGLLSITSEGVDKIEERLEKDRESSRQRLTDRNRFLNDKHSSIPPTFAKTQEPADNVPVG